MSTEQKFNELLGAGFDRAKMPEGETIIVAFSGGPDSSALLYGMTELAKDKRWQIVAGHVNHQIRRETSQRDLDRTKEIAAQLSVEFTATTVDVPEFANSEGISIELAARTLRYQSLAKIVANQGAYAVVTGHTRDDQAETVLHHASRGAGLKGISGMSVSGKLEIPGYGVEVNVIRPMLDIPHACCVEICKARGITPIHDESNLSREYTRNKLRLEVVPNLNEAVPGASQALARLARNSADDLQLIEWVVNQHLDRITTGINTYSRAGMSGLPEFLTRRLVIGAYERALGHSLDLERVHIDAILDLLNGPSGKSLKLPNEAIFYIDKETFGFRLGGIDDCPYPQLSLPQNISVPGILNLGQNVRLAADVVERPDNLDTRDLNMVFATPDLTRESLTLRYRSDGDRIQPLGTGNSVKLQDLFVNAGVPSRWRSRIPVVDSPNGIVWVPGHRMAEWAKVRPKHSKVVILQLQGLDSRQD